MIVLRRILLLVSCAILLTGCPHKTMHQKVESIVSEYRGTKEWNISKAAFKRILREYVHGDAAQVSDAQLEAEFEAYVTLSKEEVDTFLQEQTCMPKAGDEPSQFYMANVAHQRHDGFFAPNQPAHNITGSGNKHAHAAFTANMLLERYPVSADSTFPPQAKNSGNPISDWKALEKALTDESKFDELFLFKSPEQRQKVFAATQALDFSTATADLFMAPLLKGNDVFSPALFATYVLKPTPEAKPSVYVVISADARGNPETPYVGLIDPESEQFLSETGFAFTYLSTPHNLLSHEFVLTDEAPLTFELWIRTAYPTHPEQPYLTVKSTMVPAVSQKTVTKFRESRLTRLILMIRKAALMRDLIRLYYPNSSDLQLWNDVGAIHGTRFRNKLEAAGLNVAVHLFDRDLWLEKPKVDPNAPLEFKLHTSSIEACAAE